MRMDNLLLKATWQAIILAAISNLLAQGIKAARENVSRSQNFWS
jgi:hypothetical protein